MKIAITTDTHLEWINKNNNRFPTIKNWVDSLLPEIEGLAISGDISSGRDFNWKLIELATYLKKPIYFVLGNHDYYGSSFKESYDKAIEVSNGKDLIFLDSIAGIEFDNGYLLGQSGFYDVQAGLGWESKLQLNDFRFNGDLAPYYLNLIQANSLEEALTHRHGLIDRIREEAKLEAFKAKEKIEKAIALGEERIIFLTHYPPFEGSCWHEGQISDGTWLPYFTSICMGKVLENIAIENPNIIIEVFCGHTHSGGRYEHLDNLIVNTGKSDYGNPEINYIIDL